MKLDLDDTRRAIIASAGHVLVTGGPGSGKTTVALLKAKERCGTLTPGQGVLFLSFSRAAVRQVVARSKAVLTPAERRLIEVKTYHLFCLEVLRAHGRLLGGRPVRFLTPPAERLRKSRHAGEWVDEQHRLSESDALYCFDLFARGAAELFEKSGELRVLYGDRFPMLIVDEFQDTDEDQWRIVKALAASMETMCLADPEQRIFDYRPEVNPRRLDIAREALRPVEFDLGQENHRSPTGRILEVADRILMNRGPLPNTPDVKEVRCYPSSFDAMVHARVLWMFRELRNKGIAEPCVAVLTRSNPFVAELSAVLGQEHTISGRVLRPIAHDVVWDAELSAASAQVVGAILESPERSREEAAAVILSEVAQFFRMKNAEFPSLASARTAEQCTSAAAAIREGRRTRLGMAKHVVEAMGTLEFRGDPVADWLLARGALEGPGGLKDVLGAARMVRMFRAADALSVCLTDLWLGKGSYAGAAAGIRRTLDRERLLSQERDHRGCVLMTIHKSKGKEFDGVVLVEGTFRSAFFDESREIAPFERSRRLLRVGITRARSLVVMVRPHRARPLVD